MARHDDTATEDPEFQTGTLETIDEEIARWAAHTRRLQAALSWRIAHWCPTTIPTAMARPRRCRHT